MDLLLAVVLFPAVALVLACGVGLLVELVGGWTMRAALVAPVGVAGLVCLSQLTTVAPLTAPATPWILLLAGLAGLVFRRHRAADLLSALKRNPWLGFASAGAFLAVAAPIILGGQVTVTGYLLDTTTFTHMAGAERIIDFGRSMANVPLDSSYGSQLQNYFGRGYPSGGHTLLGGLGGLIPEPIIWLFNPLLAFLVAASVPSLFVILRRVGFAAPWGAAAAFFAAVPALVYGFALVGSIKEITVLPMICLLGALLVEQRRWMRAGWRAAAPLSVAAAAGIAAIGLAFGAWLAVAVLILLAVAITSVVRSEERPLSVLAVVAGGVIVLAIAAAPSLIDLASTFQLATTIAESNPSLAADPGNLLQPIHALQSVGVWLHGDYRIDPPTLLLWTYALIAIVIASALLGTIQMFRARAFVLIAWLVGLLVVWKLLTDRGTAWTDAKMVMLSSPIIAIAAWSAVASLASAPRKPEALLLTAILAAGVVWSDMLIYHDTNRAPAERFNEMIEFGDVVGSGGPTLVPDFDEGAYVALPRGKVSGPGLTGVPVADLKTKVRGGGPIGYGETVSLDQLRLRAVEAFPIILMRRSPEVSRPPSNYRLARSGRFYELWRKDPAAPKVLAHAGAFGDGTATGRVPCSRIREVANTARKAGGNLVVAQRQATVVIDPRRAKHSPGWTRSTDGLALAMPGDLQAKFRVPNGGRWKLWVKGDIGRPVSVSVDGRPVGDVAYQSGGQGNYAKPLYVELAPGWHRLELVRGGGGLEPGNGTLSVLRRVVLVRSDQSKLSELPAGSWRSLCGRSDLDWVEAVAPGK